MAKPEMKIDSRVWVRLFAPQQQSLDANRDAGFFEALAHGTDFRRFPFPAFATGKFSISREWHVGAARADQIVTGLFDNGDPNPLCDQSTHRIASTAARSRMRVTEKLSGVWSLRNTPFSGSRMLCSEDSKHPTLLSELEQNSTAA